ncbi:hypothetical protein BH09BAC3_BH09BAC3_18890 [soil metagenome]
MKSPIIVFFFLILASCGKTTDHSNHDNGDAVTDNPNQALYDEVIDIHDEVMPKMEDIYGLKKTLEEKLANTPDLAAEKKAEIEKVIMSLDSANDAMMNWMHQFSPQPDSADRETAREYYETEMERIKKVRDITNETLVKAKALAEAK